MHRDIRILLQTSTFFNLALGLLGPLYALFAQQVGGDVLSTSAAWAAYALTTGAITIALSRLSDRMQRGRLMIPVGYAFHVVGSLGYLLVGDPIGLAAVQVLLGIGSATTNPPWNALFSLSLDRGKESSQWGLWEGSASMLLGIGAVVGGLIVNAAGFHAVFLAMAGLNAMTLVASVQLLIANPTRHNRRDSTCERNARRREAPSLSTRAVGRRGERWELRWNGDPTSNRRCGGL